MSIIYIFKLIVSKFNTIFEKSNSDNEFTTENFINNGNFLLQSYIYEFFSNDYSILFEIANNYFKILEYYNKNGEYSDVFNNSFV